MNNKPFKFFEALDEVKKHIEPTFQEITTTKSNSLKRVFRSTYKDAWFESGSGFIEITIEHGPVVRNVINYIKKPWYKRIFE